MVDVDSILDPGVEPGGLFVAEVPKCVNTFFDFFLPRIDRKNPLRLTKKSKGTQGMGDRAHECRSKVIFVVLCYKNTRLRGQSFTIPATNGR